MMLTKEEKCEEALSSIEFTLHQRVKPKKLGHCEDDNLNILWELIKEHFDNPQIDWLKNCMGEEAFNLIFSSQEEVNKWFDRMRWHVKKCDEYGRELDILKNNPPLKFDELKEGMWVWDNKYKYYFECNPRISTDMAECVWYESFWYNTGEGYDEFYEDYIEFEENRFYRKEVQ